MYSSEIFQAIERKRRASNNVGKTVAIFPQIFRETLGALAPLVGTTKA